MNEADRRHWERERQDYLQTATERNLQEVRDMDLAADRYLRGYLVSVQKREAAEKRLKT